MSNVPSAQVAFFPALTLDMQCVLVGLRSKTALNRCALKRWAIATERSRSVDRVRIKRCECRYRPDSYCNPKTQNRRERRAGLFASPLGGRMRGKVACRAFVGRLVSELTV